MKPLPETKPESRRLLAFGAHPDDVEFGAGGIVAQEALEGTQVHLVICSEGESATHGSPRERRQEAEVAAKTLGSTVEFISLGGDAHFERKLQSTLILAEVIRRLKPHWVLAPTPTESQHPDHAVLGSMMRDAARLARYGGVSELKANPAHAIESLFFYAVGPEGEMRNSDSVWVDISAPIVIQKWNDAMAAHRTQAKTRDYVELQITRARLLGLRAGVEYAQALYPSEPLVVANLKQLGKAARRF